MRDARDIIRDLLAEHQCSAAERAYKEHEEGADRILTALSSAGIDCAGWRDIESAPKDGKPILLWKESTQEHYVAAWVHGAHGPGCCTPDGFQIFRATHWRPLPLPPLASGGG